MTKDYSGDASFSSYYKPLFGSIWEHCVTTSFQLLDKRNELPQIDYSQSNDNMIDNVVDKKLIYLSKSPFSANKVFEFIITQEGIKIFSD